MSLNAYNLQCLKDMGIRIADLGCVMLDLEPVDLSGVIDPDWEYHSANPDNYWVSGVQREAHVTLLYGLLRKPMDILTAVDEVLADWARPGCVTTDRLEVFPSPLADEPYSCIVARTDQLELRDAHARLSLLPHINTNPTYKPHVTLAYVKRERMDDALTALHTHFGASGIDFGASGIDFSVLGLNYGDR